MEVVKGAEAGRMVGVKDVGGNTKAGLSGKAPLAEQGARSKMQAVYETVLSLFLKQVLSDVVRKVRVAASYVDLTVLLSGMALVGGFVGIVAAMYHGYVTPYLEWVAGQGLLGNFLVVLSFVPVSMPFVMGYTPLTMATGYIYGVGWGLLTSEIGALVGGSIAFMLTRHLFREKLLRRMERHAQFRGFMIAVERHGFKIVVMMRCVPIPFGIQNGLFAVSNVSFSKYILATLIGLIPGQIMCNYFGTTLHGFSDILSGRHEFTDWQTYMLYSQLLVACFVFVFLFYLGKRAMVYADIENVEVVCIEDGGIVHSHAMGPSGSIVTRPILASYCSQGATSPYTHHPYTYPTGDPDHDHASGDEEECVDVEIHASHATDIDIEPRRKHRKVYRVCEHKLVSPASL